jgi:hypothetical protein
MDGVQEVCADADVLPCVFDAAVVSYMIRQTSADLALIGRRFPKATRRTYKKTATKACDGNIPSATKEQPGLLTLPEESVKLPAIVRQDMKQSRALCAQTRQVVQSSQLFLARLLREHSQRQRD